MFESLRRLDGLADSTMIFPGHRYSNESHEELESVRRHNFVLKHDGQRAVDDDFRGMITART